MPAAPVEGAPHLMVPDGRPVLRLEKAHLEALGLDALAAGTEVAFIGVGRITRSTTADTDADGHTDHACVELTIEELGVEADEPEDKRSAFEKRDESAARLYAKPHTPSGSTAPEFGVFNTRYGK